MKSFVNRNNFNWCIHRGMMMISLIFMFSLPSFSQGEEAAQADTTVSDTTTVVDDEANEKASLRLTYDAFKINKDIKLLAKLKTKVKGKFQNIPDVLVSFYKNEIDPANFLGKTYSNSRGEAFWIIPAALPADSASPLSFWAVVQNNPVYEDAEETVSVVPSVIEMKLEEEDSLRLVKVFLGYPDETNQIIPVPDAECKLYVQRLFGFLPVGESATTDAEGNAIIEFPQDIKGDESGNVTIIARFEEHELVGNVEANQTIQWGIATAKDDFYVKRELWSARANSPILLVIIVNMVLIGVWGAIAFIFLEIFRINKLGKTHKSPL